MPAVDKVTPGPGDHQTPTGGNHIIAGPAFSFAGTRNAAGGGAAAVVADEDVKQALAHHSNPPSLAQLQAQLARLLIKTARPKTQLVAAAAAVQGVMGATGSSDSSSNKPTSTSTTAATAKHALSNSCQALSDGLRTKSNKGSSMQHTAHKGRSNSKTVQGSHKLVSPGPGEYYQCMSAATGTVGASGPAFTICAHNTKSSDVLVQRQGSGSVAAAAGLTAVLRAAAAADRAAGNPGPGAYNVNGSFPEPEGANFYKPILKRTSSNSRCTTAADGAFAPSGRQQQPPLPSSTRRVSWADQS